MGVDCEPTHPHLVELMPGNQEIKGAFEPRFDQQGRRAAFNNQGRDENVRVENDTHGSARLRGPAARAHARDCLGNLGVDNLEVNFGVAGTDSGECSRD